MSKRYFVYMLASKRNGTLYTGVTGDLGNRVWEHRNSLIEGFIQKYGVHLLVWFEEHGDIGVAIEREKTNQRLEQGVENPADREDQFRVE